MRYSVGNDEQVTFCQAAFSATGDQAAPDLVGRRSAKEAEIAGLEAREELLLIDVDARSHLLPQQEAKLHSDGSLSLRVPYADATELAMDILRHGEQVKVLAPAALARDVGERLTRAAARYGA